MPQRNQLVEQLQQLLSKSHVAMNVDPSNLSDVELQKEIAYLQHETRH